MIDIVYFLCRVFKPDYDGSLNTDAMMSFGVRSGKEDSGVPGTRVRGLAG